jgi:hypothetical protein
MMDIDATVSAESHAEVVYPAGADDLGLPAAEQFANKLCAAGATATEFKRNLAVCQDPQGRFAAGPRQGLSDLLSPLSALQERDVVSSLARGRRRELIARVWEQVAAELYALYAHCRPVRGQDTGEGHLPRAHDHPHPLDR